MTQGGGAGEPPRKVWPRPPEAPFLSPAFSVAFSSQLLAQLAKKERQVGRPPLLCPPDQPGGAWTAARTAPESWAHTALGRREAGMGSVRGLVRMPNRERPGLVWFSFCLSNEPAIC